MIRHEQKQRKTPIVQLMVMSCRRKNRLGDCRIAELVNATRLAANGNEKYSVGRTDEVGRIMRERFAAGLG